MTNDDTRTLTSRIEMTVSVDVTRPWAASWDMDGVARGVLSNLPDVETTTTGNGTTYPATVRVLGASPDRWGEREYMRDVQDIARDVRASWEAGDLDDVGDAIHEAVDGSAWVIYYAGQRAVIRWTENVNAADDIGADWSDVDTALTAIAFWAMRADVNDALSREWGDPSDWARDEDEDDEDDVDPHAYARQVPGGFLAVYDTDLNDHHAPTYVLTSGGWEEGYRPENVIVFDICDHAVAAANGYPNVPKTGGDR